MLRANFDALAEQSGQLRYVLYVEHVSMSARQTPCVFRIGGPVPPASRAIVVERADPEIRHVFGGNHHQAASIGFDVILL